MTLDSLKRETNFEINKKIDYEKFTNKYMNYYDGKNQGLFQSFATLSKVCYFADIFDMS